VSYRHTTKTVSPVTDVGRVPRRFDAQVVRFAGTREAIWRSGEMRDRIDPDTNSKHDQSTAYPRRSVKAHAQVAYDQQSRYADNLVRARYPSCLAAGQCKPTLYCGNGGSQQSVHDKRLEKTSDADEDEKPARGGNELETGWTTAETSESILEPVSVGVLDGLRCGGWFCVCWCNIIHRVE